MKVILENELTAGLAYQYPRRMFEHFVFNIGNHLFVNETDERNWSPDEHTSYKVVIKRTQNAISIDCSEYKLKERKVVRRIRNRK